MKILLPYKNNAPPDPKWQHPIQLINGRIHITLGASQIANFLMCPTYWVYSDVERMRQQPLTILTEDHKTDRGTYGHSLMDCFYKAKARLRNINDALVFTLDAIPEIREKSKLLVSTYEEIEKAFKQYCMNAIVSNVDFDPISEDSVEIGFTRVLLETDRFVFTIQGRIDMLAKFMGYEPFVVVDHKYQWSVNTLYSYNPQFRTYAMVTNAPALIANYIRVYVKSTTFERQVVGFSENDHYRWRQYLIDNVFHKIMGSLTFYGGSSINIKESLKKIEEKSNLQACKGEYNICQFTKICERLEPIGHPIREATKTFYHIGEGHVPW